MQNVLFVIYRLYGGGAERVVSNLSQALDGKYNITIAVFGDEEKTYPYKGELVRIKLPFSKDPIQNNKLQRTIRFFLLNRQLRKLKKKFNIDTAISFGEQANIINVLSKTKEQVFVSMRTTLSKEIQNAPKLRILSGFIKRLYNRADGVIVPSALAGRDLVRFFNVDEAKLKVIYNYIDPALITGLSQKDITEPDLAELFRQKVLLNVGRITPAKGQWLLFHLYKRLKDRYPEIRLVIIGEGESEHHFKTKLVAYAQQLGLKLFDRTATGNQFSIDYDVYLLGFEPNPFRFMNKSELLLFPSTFEGFPNTIIEAMQSKLAVVAADCESGPREIIAPHTPPDNHTTTTIHYDYGILAPSLPSSLIEESIDEVVIQEWEKAVVTLLDDEQLRNKYIANGLKRATDFEKEIILKEWEGLFNHR